jgi:hypothetical protein
MLKYIHSTFYPRTGNTQQLLEFMHTGWLAIHLEIIVILYFVYKQNLPWNFSLEILDMSYILRMFSVSVSVDAPRNYNFIHVNTCRPSFFKKNWISLTWISIIFIDAISIFLNCLICILVKRKQLEGSARKQGWETINWQQNQVSVIKKMCFEFVSEIPNMVNFQQTNPLHRNSPNTRQA